MINLKRLVGGVAFVALSAALVPSAFAQVTTSGVRGTVSDASGAPVGDATVTIEDTRTGLTRRVLSTPGGSFDVRGLNPGGPYNVTVSKTGEQPTQISDVFLDLGSTTDVNLAFSGSGLSDVVVITASAQNTAELAVGPSFSFGYTEIQSTPAINRDLKDIVRLDPRIQLDEGNVDAIQCAGANPRYNSLTVDGVGLNDGFGLNSNGYPTERMPFPFDAIESVSVELAPFDVQYGSFTGCAINAVTQSGSNEFHGSVFFDYTDDSLTGDKVEGASVAVPEFDEKRYGFTLGGPIIPDSLFFFAAYEKFEGVNVFGAGPEGSGAALEIPGLTQAELDRIVAASTNLYGYDPGGIPSDAPTEDEKYLVRVDWLISDRHRAALTYNFNKGSNLTRSDDDPNEFEFAGHLYNRGAELTAYSGQLFSDWTDDFSTDIRISQNEVDATVASQFGTDVGEVQIRDSGNIIYLGADDSRHANDLDYKTLSIKAAGNYRTGDHVLTFGAEQTQFEVFNLFVQETEGEWRFNSIADFEAGLVERVIYENAAPSNDPNDASATFAYDMNTTYLQDEWSLDGGVTLTAGLRYDWYESNDTPVYNANFEARNGFRNDETLDGRDLLMPRFAFTWDAAETLTVRGGLGLFSGGNPNVWISNNYSNNGITQVERVLRNAPNTIDLFDPAITYVEDERGGVGGPLWGIPESLFDGVANGTANGGVNALDPDFEIPSTWKTALGFTWDFDLPNDMGTGYRLNADLLFAKDENAAIVKDLSLVRIGTLPDGRPRYRRVDRSDPDCAIDPAAGACSSRGFNNDFLLTNTSGGEVLTLSAVLDKSYDFGLDWSLGYAYIDAKDVNPMTSSVAFSNWSNIGVSDPENNQLVTSNYETPHNLTLRVSYENEFIADYATRVTLVGRAFQARPFAFTFEGDDGDIVGDNANNRHLLYVPTVGDSRVVYAPGFDLAGFDAYIERYGLARGQIDGRNSHEGSWSNKFDLRFEQELPGLLANHRTKAFLVIENIGNLLNDDWGTLKQAGFPQTLPVVDASYDAITNTYTYQEFFNREAEGLENNQFQSVWSVRGGLKYEF